MRTELGSSSFSEVNTPSVSDAPSFDPDRRIDVRSPRDTPAEPYDPDKRPVLLVEEGQDISVLENEPAIRRKPQKNEQ